MSSPCHGLTRTQEREAGAGYGERTVVVDWELLPLFAQRETGVLCIGKRDDHSVTILLDLSVDQTSYDENEAESESVEGVRR